MTESQFFHQMLKRFSLKAASDPFDFNQFAVFIQKTAQKNPEFPGVAAYISGDINSAVEAGLRELEKQGHCNVNRQGAVPVSISFPQFYVSRITGTYRRIEDNPEIPFPTEQKLGVFIPPNLIIPANVKDDFSRVLERSGKNGGEIYRFSFPDGIDSMVVSADLVPSKLLELSVQKIRLYLNTAKNADYIKNKLAGIFRQREQLLRELFTTVQTQNRLAIESITNPSEFTYLFWTHTANAILSEYRQKTEKLVVEHGFCQAAYLAGLYALHHKGVTQKRKEKETALRTVEQNLRKPPFFFTHKDIAGFKDPKGLLLSRNLSSGELSEFLKQVTTESSEGKMPEIIHVRGGSESDYYICKDKLLTLCLRKIISASQEYRKHFIDEFKKNLEAFRKTEAMSTDAGFAKAIEGYLAEEDPLLNALLRYELLYLILEDTKPGEEIRQETERLFDRNRQTLISFDRIFRMDRRTLIAKAKKLIPIWKTVKPLAAIVLFFGRLFGGKAGAGGRPEGAVKRSAAGADGRNAAGAAPAVEVRTRRGVPTAAAGMRSGVVDGAGGASSSAAPKKDSMVEFRKAVYALKLQFAGKDASLDSLLADLAEKWNPLYDPAAKADLVEDVNSLVRDYLRPLKRGFIGNPPDAARITNLARTLSENKALAQIKKREMLTKYLELYMIKQLSQK